MSFDVTAEFGAGMGFDVYKMYLTNVSKGMHIRQMIGDLGLQPM
jgi:hypothetical protein